VFLSRADGSAFSLKSFDGAEFPNSGDAMFYSASGVRVTGRLLDNSFLSQDFLFDGINDGTGGVVDFETFFPSLFSSVLELQFRGIQGAGIDFAVDNIVVNSPVAEVPEPTSVALLGLGLAGLLARPRRSAK
jgi:hypothetical protein